VRLRRSIYMKLLFAAVLLAQSAFAPLFNASHWIGPQPTAKQLAGKVVLVDVFTYSCINCKHVVPELQRLRRQYGSDDLVIIGVHTPELQSDYVRSNVEQNLAIQGITWPVAIDNDQKLWNAYGVNAWPTQLFFDRNGRLRKTIVGDSQDDDVSATVRALVGSR
jgi:thiol-disulfide isomerase/thioredoxin